MKRENPVGGSRRSRKSAMPITPVYTWRESATWVTIDVTLCSIQPSSDDITSTECYVKLNHPPYLFQADLFGDIDDQKSSVVINPGLAKFFLVKKNEGIWGRLTTTLEKKEALERRKNSLDAATQKSLKCKEERKLKVSQFRRLAVDNQMKIEEAKRRTIENRKEKELQTERDYIEEWQKHLQASPEFLNNQRVVPDISYTACENTIVSSSSENRIHEHQKDLKGLSQASEINDIMGKSDLINTGAHCPENNIPKEVKNKNTETAHIKKTRTEEYSSNISNKVNSQEFTALGSVSSCLSDKTDQRLTSSEVLPSNACFEAAVAKILPAPRKSISIAVKFSPKTLPNHLPARESREKVQLKESRQTSADTLDVSEREPLFLQDKGDAFYRSGDFRSAINAYTDALAKDSSMVLCYANRAACELQMKEFQSCIDDCTIAIQLLKGRLQEEDGLNTPQCLKNDVACGKGSGNKNGTIKTDLGDTIKMVKDDDTHLKFLVHGSLSLLTLPSIQIYGGENATAAKKWNLSVQSCVLARCGCARCNIGDLDGGASDFAAAFMLDPKNIEIQRTLEEVKQRLESIKSLISH